MKISNEKIILSIVFLIFASIYCSISLVNHYFLRTYALDLGMFNQAIYSFSHLKMNYFTLDITGAEISYFGDHFSPIIIFLSPFYYLFGSYTLLIIQIACILLGGFGVYKYASLNHSQTYIPLLLTIQFFSIWGIYSALSFDYHNNVIAAMFVPWLFYFYDKKNKKAFLLFFVLIILCKENMSLWLGFILIGLTLKRLVKDEWKNQLNKILKFEIPLIVFSFLYFVIIVGKIMPMISHGQGTNQLSRYSLLGNSITEIVSTLIHHPKYIFSLLFESPLNDGISFGIKSELHFMVLISGGFALLYRPYYLIMLIPIYAQKFLANDFGFWGINSQYSIEFVPILSLCLSDFLSNRKSMKRVYGVAIITTLTTIFFTLKTIEKRTSLWYEKTNTAFYLDIHYKSTLNVKEIKEALNLIPKNAIISVNPAVAPRLAFRDKVYHFPIVKDADYIVLLTSKGNSYPLNEEDFSKKVNEYIKNDKFLIQYQKNDLLILRKKHFR